LEVFVEAELINNITHSDLVPKYAILSDHEKKDFFKFHKIINGQTLCKMKATDSVANYFDYFLQAGQV